MVVTRHKVNGSPNDRLVVSMNSDSCFRPFMGTHTCENRFVLERVLTLFKTPIGANVEFCMIRTANVPSIVLMIILIKMGRVFIFMTLY